MSYRDVDGNAVDGNGRAIPSLPDAIGGTKHTPGPWYRNIPPAKKYPVIFAGRNTYVAIIDRGLPEEEIEANCSLIAAAPKLLKQLKICHAALVWHPGGDDRSEEDIAETEAVIAKAEGR